MSYSETLQNVWSDDSKRIVLSTSAFGKNTYFYPQEVGFFKTQYPYSAQRNELESFLVIVTTKGKGFLEYENKKYTLTPNTILFIDCYRQHKYYASKEASWEFYWIHFYGAASQGYYHQFSIANKSPIVHTHNVQNAIDAIANVIDSSEHPTPLSEAFCSKYVTDLLTELIYLTVSHPEETVLPPPLRHIMEETDKRFTDKRLTLRAFAEELHLNESHLCRMFKRYFGTTFIRFITMKRLAKAKELLKYTQLSIAQVAEQCGFDPAGYFIKVFTKYEGLTPLTYRHKGQ